MNIQLTLYWGFLLFSILIVAIQLSPLPAFIRHRVARIFSLPVKIGNIQFRVGSFVVVLCLGYILMQYHNLGHFSKPEEDEHIEALHNRLRKKWLHEIYIHQAWIILVTWLAITGIDYLRTKQEKLQKQLVLKLAKQKKQPPPPPPPQPQDSHINRFQDDLRPAGAKEKAD